MHARKPRYDESFVDTQPVTRQPAGDSEIKIIGAGAAEYAPSPARELQKEIRGRLQNVGITPPSTHYSGRTNILIISSFSLLLWAAILGAGWLVAG
ncbi:hypothetical protein SAMN02745824_0652 [Parasphingorhabdus marina DSM 22363]|uniref:Uncharacterized protein n=1 Tax=Parasphingorhabdus marina DSM 22363 TaxID=1123272 RepID=A0A1N6CPE1_9SPHN|nr:hypothetical protein [Parasphingorhabdus marina]SIN60377.1 hypothetical protein SAMN02745824_0652 [Parasphingorhabdus marina DSM 22363]